MVLEVSIGEGVEVSLVGPPSFLQLLLSVGLFEDWAEDHGGKVLFHLLWGGGAGGVNTADPLCPVDIVAVWLEHIAMESAPRFSVLPMSTYSDEDMVGKVKRFVLLSHPGRTMGSQLLNRYAAYCCRWPRSLTE